MLIDSLPILSRFVIILDHVQWNMTQHPTMKIGHFQNKSSPMQVYQCNRVEVLDVNISVPVRATQS